eukprot:CAMPEP_0171140444 /NCGR_PEP_ID=MMETSP0766_2-20121228/138725_1 /TAXON_ID=439317 /ORGANISM="Gambierdiscus australes, Strain CAWD 149" /LENGTH=242 /DNA_ID=CAMNT_0011604131 /DNA_START=75 /DNA_END=804 /DNA_ORIENTATION=+
MALVQAVCTPESTPRAHAAAIADATPTKVTAPLLVDAGGEETKRGRGRSGGSVLAEPSLATRITRMREATVSSPAFPAHQGKHLKWLDTKGLMEVRVKVPPTSRSFRAQSKSLAHGKSTSVKVAVDPLLDDASCTSNGTAKSAAPLQHGSPSISPNAPLLNARALGAAHTDVRGFNHSGPPAAVVHPHGLTHLGPERLHDCAVNVSTAPTLKAHVPQLEELPPRALREAAPGQHTCWSPEET